MCLRIRFLGLSLLGFTESLESVVSCILTIPASFHHYFFNSFPQVCTLSPLLLGLWWHECWIFHYCLIGLKDVSFPPPQSFSLYCSDWIIPVVSNITMIASLAFFPFELRFSWYEISSHVSCDFCLYLWHINNEILGLFFLNFAFCGCLLMLVQFSKTLQWFSGLFCIYHIQWSVWGVGGGSQGLWQTNYYLFHVCTSLGWTQGFKKIYEFIILSSFLFSVAKLFSQFPKFSVLGLWITTYSMVLKHKRPSGGRTKSYVTNPMLLAPQFYSVKEFLSSQIWLLEGIVG